MIIIHHNSLYIIDKYKQERKQMNDYLKKSINVCERMKQLANNEVEFVNKTRQQDDVEFLRQDVLHLLDIINKSIENLLSVYYSHPYLVSPNLIEGKEQTND